MLKLPWSKHVWCRSFSIVFNSRTEEAGTRNPHSLLHPQACCGSIKGRLKPSSRTTLGPFQLTKEYPRWTNFIWIHVRGATFAGNFSLLCFGGPLMHQVVEPHFTSGWAGSLNASAPWPAVSGCCGASTSMVCLNHVAGDKARCLQQLGVLEVGCGMLWGRCFHGSHWGVRSALVLPMCLQPSKLFRRDSQESSQLYT